MDNQKPKQHSSILANILKNLSLIALSILLLPITTTIVASCLLYNHLFPSPPLPSCSRKTILISSLAMTKGLTLARAFYLSGHRVIGLDLKLAHIPSSGRFSKALSAHYELIPPITPSEKKAYSQRLIEIIKKENIDLWVCVSGVATTTEDALAKLEIEKQTRCVVFQPSPETCETLHDKNHFVEKTAGLGLRIPETRMVTSHAEALTFLADKTPGRYILKSVWLDDVSRADMTLYPCSSTAETIAQIRQLSVTPKKPWIFQEFINGDEYCTHAVIIKGVVAAFVACASSELLMHYKALSEDSDVSKRLLEFTRTYAKGLEGGEVTGQLSFDVVVKEREGELLLYPIECNPRTHTAVILFNRYAAQLAECYLGLLDSSCTPKRVCTPDPITAGSYYWVGHDIVTLLLLPLLEFGGPKSLLSGLKELAIHVLFWRDAAFQSWDPVPFWVLYHVYWPCVFMRSLIRGRWWKRVNVSTTRVFEG